MSVPQVAAPPPGWVQHPQAPTYFYNPAVPSQMVQVVAPAAPPSPQPAQPTYAAPPQPTQYGAVNVQQAVNEYETSGFKKDTLYIDFPEVKTVGQTVELLVRLLPPWARDEPSAWASTARHRLYGEFNVKAQQKPKHFYPDCFNGPSGPKDCPICEVRTDLASMQNDEANKYATEMEAKERHYWQALDLRNLTQHYRQLTRNGQLVLDPQTGQPQWTLVPGIVSMGTKLHRKLLLFFKQTDITLPDRGLNITLVKKKTGPEDMNVEYDAVADLAGPTPIPMELRHVLGNLMDLRASCIRLRPRDEMKQIADAIRARFGAVKVQVPMGMPSVPAFSPPSAWITHPNNPAYEYDPMNPSNVRLKQVAPPPPPPMAAPPPAPPPAVFAPPPPPMMAPPPVAAPAPVYAAPPPMPMQFAPPAPPTYAAPPPPPVMPMSVAVPPPPPGMALPPPIAPGLVPGAYGAAPAPIMPGMPAAIGAMPELPPPPVGIGAPPPPPGPPQLAVPPPPPGAPGAPMTPEQLEAAIKASPHGSPF